MRLTLRTMLAYLDNVLDPADAEVLGRKINESDFASGLIERLRGVLKKLRMDAPRVDGKGIGGDANTVAEYLDSTLPQDRVGDFERVCLESDKHLCEVAACHQILTLVLGKPADVPEELRERIYALGHPDRLPTRRELPPAAAAALNDSKVVPPPVVRANGQAAQQQPEVPAYLRGGQRGSLWPVALTVAATFLIAVGVLRLLGPFDRSHPVLRMLGRGTEIAALPEPAAPPVPVQERGPDETKDAAPASKEATAFEENAPRVPATDTPTPAAAPAVAVPAAFPPSDEPPAIQPAQEPAVAAKKNGAKSEDAVPVPMPTPLAPEPAAAPAERVAAVPIAPRPAPRPEVKPPLEVGRYTSDGQVLATLSPDDGLWYMKPVLATVVAGEHLAILPTFRPQVALPGVQVTLAGEGMVRMEAPGESGASAITVDFGRMLIVPVAAAGEKLELDLAGVKGVATLVDADSSLAIKVVRWLPPGFDPATGPGMPVIELFNASGRITWQEADQDKIDIPPRHVHVYLGADPPETHGPFQPPEWIDARSIAPIDRRASLALEGQLDKSKPLNVSLQEQLTDRRVEVRPLAARCLALLGDFEPIVRELSDARQYSFWQAEMEALVQALARGPETAAEIRTVLERTRAADAADLYRLLWGYSPEQLERGGAAQLVKFLEHPQLDVRVLAFYNLVAITGAQEQYRPERQPAQSRSAILNWKDRLEKKSIVYKTLPSPVENYKPPAAPAGVGTR